MSEWQSSIASAADEIQRASRLALELSDALGEAERMISNLSSERFDEDDVPGEDVCVMAARIERDVMDAVQRISSDVSLAISNARDIGPRAQDQVTNY